MFKRSTRQIVLGRKQAAEAAGNDTYMMEEITMENPRKSSLKYIALTVGILAVILLIVWLCILLAGSYTSQENTTSIPEGMGVVSCDSMLAVQAEAGDVVRLYNAEGQAITELQYVEVLSAADGSLLLLMDDLQAEAYIQQFGGTVSLVALAGTEQAESMLSYQRQVLNPEINLSALADFQAAPGEAVQLALTVTETPTGAIVPEIVWHSSDPSVATVDSSGFVSAVDIGSAVITASCGEVSVSCTIRVRVALAEITLSQSEAEIGVGETLSLTAAPQPENATDFAAQWSVDDSSIASVDSDGNVTGVSVGTAVVTVQCGDISASCTIRVGVYAEMIQLEQHTLEMLPGDTESLTYSIYPAEGITQALQYTSSNEEVATVNADGTVTAVSRGTATITISCGEVSDTCSITVY